MKTKPATIIVAAWVLCLFVLLLRTLFFTPSAKDVAITMTVPMVFVYAGYCLYKKPNRKLTLWFSVMCLLMLFKFFFGSIIYYDATTHTVSGAFLKWWALGTSNVLSFIDSIGIAVLVPITFYYWPVYCWRYKKGKKEEPTA